MSKPGDVLKRKSPQPWKLMARLQIAETQAKDILLGQKASIDTRNGVVPGHVTRIDASIINGTRTSGLQARRSTARGRRARSERGRHDRTGAAGEHRVCGAAGVRDSRTAKMSLFRLEPDGKEAARVVVGLGRASVNNVEVLDGLKPGDQVVLSDMSAQDQNPAHPPEY